MIRWDKGWRLILRLACALIVTIMPLGPGISIGSDVSFGAPVADLKRSGVGGSGNDSGSNDTGGGDGGSAPGSSVSGGSIEFNGSVEPAGPDLSEQEEQDLISRGWR